MGKSIIFSVLFLIGILLITYPLYMEKNRKSQVVFELQQKINNAKNVVNKIDRLPSKSLPQLAYSLWGLNMRVKEFEHLYAQEADFKTGDVPEDLIAQWGSESLTMKGFKISFNNLRDRDDHLKVINMLEQLRKDFPVEIYRWEGFDGFIQVDGIVFARKEYV